MRRDRPMACAPVKMPTVNGITSLLGGSADQAALVRLLVDGPQRARGLKLSAAMHGSGIIAFIVHRGAQLAVLDSRHPAHEKIFSRVGAGGNEARSRKWSCS